MTALNPDTHHRRSVRLRDYDYAQAGVYFVTINTRQRECFFGEAEDGDMQLNDMGIIAKACWEGIDQHCMNVILDAFVIMPNHVHGVLVNVGAQHAAPLQSYQPTPGSLGAIIRSYKSAVTKNINQRLGTPGAPIWQRSYYEHIIRDESELRQIRAYIKQNPARWAEDEYHPDYDGKPLRARHASPLQAPKKQGTRTSAFGSPGRISHDAAAFYAGWLYENYMRKN